MMYMVLVDIQLRDGIADPQGATIERALPALGFTGVAGVHVGKTLRFTVDADDEHSAREQVDDMVRRFLSNPVIEDAFVALEPEA